MAAIAHDAEDLELDAGTVRAWSSYSESLHGLTGDAYDVAELESWAELQSELGRLHRRRQSLNQTAPSQL